MFKEQKQKKNFFYCWNKEKKILFFSLDQIYLLKLFLPHHSFTPLSSSQCFQQNSFDIPKLVFSATHNWSWLIGRSSTLLLMMMVMMIMMLELISSLQAKQEGQEEAENRKEEMNESDGKYAKLSVF